MTKNKLAFLFLVLTIHSSKASDIVEIVPVTNKILAIHFDDGYTVYHKKGQKRSNELVVVEILNISEAGKTENYTISSLTNAAYKQAKQPIDLGRKTKGSEFIWICQQWNNGCVNLDSDYVKEHWIYLFLADPLQNNHKYILNTSDVANNEQVWNFTSGIYYYQIYNPDDSDIEIFQVN